MDLNERDDLSTLSTVFALCRCQFPVGDKPNLQLFRFLGAGFHIVFRQFNRDGFLIKNKGQRT